MPDPHIVIALGVTGVVLLLAAFTVAVLTSSKRREQEEQRAWVQHRLDALGAEAARKRGEAGR